MISIRRKGALLLVALLLILMVQRNGCAFVITPSVSRFPTILFDMADPSKMRAGEIRKELESYGIPTKSFLEKKELVDAVKKARAEGKTPIQDTVNGEKDQTSSRREQTKQATSSSSSDDDKEPSSRKEKLEKEVAKAKSMTVKELKKVLQDFGISTRSFFEKTEFVTAYAEAMVDGVKKKGSPPQQEEYDPSYRDVDMQKFDKRLLLGTSSVIDISPGR